MSKITLFTLVPTDLNEQQQVWLETCMNSVKGSSFNHILISCENEAQWYEYRTKIYTYGGFVGCLDYDDYLIPDSAEEMYKLITTLQAQLYFSYESLLCGTEILEPQHREVTSRDVTQGQKIIHHLTILNSSLIPKDLFELVNNLGISKNIDWICKAYIALKFKALQFPKSTYVWRQHEESATKKWRKDYAKIQQITTNLLKCIAPSDKNLFTPYELMGN